MSIKKTLLAAALLPLPVAAQAQPVTGLYVGAGVGMNMLMQTDLLFEDAYSISSEPGGYRFDRGWVGLVSLGYGFGNGVRAEIEGSFRDNRAESIHGFGIPAGELGARGHARSYGVMANALYDFDLGSSFPVMPYVGVGAGFIWHNYDTKLFPASFPDISISTQDEQGRFAYQAILGASLPLDSISPALALTAEYRFMGSLQPGLKSNLNYPDISVPYDKVRVDNFNHSVMLGVRYAFNADPPPVAVPAPAITQSQPVTGLYVGAGVGINMLATTDGEWLLRSGEAIWPPQFGFDPGWAGVISLGYGFGNGVRAEIEGSFRQNNASSVTGFDVPDGMLGTSGRARSYGVMANALYDFDLGSSIPLTPYVGVGAGYVWHQYDVRVFERSFPEYALAIDDQQGRFAYQVIVGAAFQIDGVAPGLALTAEYRFMGSLQPELSSGFTYGPNSEPFGKLQVDNFNHSVLLGIRYAFNAAPPPAPVVAPAPAAAAPAPARTFLVFFDFDRADLTDRARAIIAEAATNAGRTGTTRIEIAGHADRSGTPQYNQALSQRRAAAVAAELERRGIARSAMTVQAFGESRPLVPTADGAREPQNRRVEIVLR